VCKGGHLNVRDRDEQEELHSFNASSNIIKVPKPQRMRQDMCAEFYLEELEGKSLLVKAKAYLEGKY
jgi:hypothetical protein